MAHQYEKSENFRANIFFSLGLILATPMGLKILDFTRTEEINHTWLSLLIWLLSITLAYFGLLMISKSYNIMLEKDQKNDK